MDFDLAVLDRIASAERVPLALGRGSGSPPAARRWAGRATRVRRASPAAWCSTGSACCAAPSCGWTTTASTRSRGRSWARARRSPAAAAPTRSCASSRRTASGSSSTTAPTPASRSRSSSGCGSSSWRSSEAASPACRSTASSSSIAAFDFLYLSALGRRRIVAPSVRGASEVVEPQGGGHVLEPLPGLYANVVVLDFKSLYPSLIRTFEIDPLNLVRPEAGQSDSDPIVAPNGAAFGRAEGHPGRDPRRAHAPARGGAPRGRQRQEPRHQDPDELLLRRARDAGLPLPRRAPRQRHHVASGARCCSGARPGSRRAAAACSTATPTACSS